MRREHKARQYRQGINDVSILSRLNEARAPRIERRDGAMAGVSILSRLNEARARVFGAYSLIMTGVSILSRLNEARAQ